MLLLEVKAGAVTTSYPVWLCNTCSPVISMPGNERKENLGDLMGNHRWLGTLSERHTWNAAGPLLEGGVCSRVSPARGYPGRGTEGKEVSSDPGGEAYSKWCV